MRSPHQIAIALLTLVAASNPVLADTSIGQKTQTPGTVSLSGCVLHSDDELGLEAARSAPSNDIQTAGTESTSEPPGPGSPSIPGGPGPPPDDDDDDDATINA